MVMLENPASPFMFNTYLPGLESIFAFSRRLRTCFHKMNNIVMEFVFVGNHLFRRTLISNIIVQTTFSSQTSAEALGNSRIITII